MRKLAVAVALATTAIASPALARDKSWYVGVEGGAMIVEDIQLDIAGIKNNATAKHRAGYDVDGIIGYDFGPFRAEAEVGYRRATVTNYSSQTTTYNGSAVPQGAGTFPEAGGPTSALSFMLNGLVDFGSDDGISGFVGGGAGVGRAKFDWSVAGPDRAFLNDSDTRFAWQALAGIRAPLTSHIDIGAKYRFFDMDNLRLIDSLGRDVKNRYRSHSLLASVIYNFGSPAAPRPCRR